MAVTLSMFNMKGGVGKTTLTVQTAWYMMANKNKKVLVVDLDPQSNASHYLMGAEMYKDYIQKDKPTTRDVFERYARGVQHYLSPYEFIYGVRTVYDAKLDVIPSSLKLSRTLKNPRGKEHALHTFLSLVEDQYDLIIIDCPPTESMFTTAAYMASQHILIPVKPEFLSTVGLPLLGESMEEFKREFNRPDLQVAGVVFNVVTNCSEADQSKREIKQFANGQDWHVFEEEISFSQSYMRSVREVSSISETKYAKQTTTYEFAEFAEAFARRIGL